MKPIKFFGQLYRVSTTKDGGGRITIEFGLDALDAIHEMQKLNAKGDTNFALAVVPFKENPPTDLTLNEELV